jgi:hypothetical protein
MAAATREQTEQLIESGGPGLDLADRDLRHLHLPERDRPLGHSSKALHIRLSCDKPDS